MSHPVTATILCCGLDSNNGYKWVKGKLGEGVLPRGHLLVVIGWASGIPLSHSCGGTGALRKV